MKKLLAFLERHSETDSEKNRLERWKGQNLEILGYTRQRVLGLWGEEEQEAIEEDIVPEEFLQVVTYLSRAEYEVEEIMAEVYLDLNEIVHFLEETSKFQVSNDDKLKKLIRLLKTKELESEKVLVFTEFADTARYIAGELRNAGIEDIEQIDGSTKGSRATIIKRFAPYYNESSSTDLAEAGLKEIRVLISTDVLSEGLNLQDASKMINYDIHWNPVRIMQRIGRVDRRMNPDIEEKLVSDNPERADTRGKVSFWNFLPPDELNEILTLYQRVTQKTLLISRTLGIEHGKLLRPDDDFNVLKEFTQSYEGKKTAIEEMHLEYQDLITSGPSLADNLENAYSGPS